jgi:protein O-mannosyl-transferase
MRVEGGEGQRGRGERGEEADAPAFGFSPFSRFPSLPLTLILYLVVGVAAYSNVVNSYFLSDDFELVGGALEGELPFTWGREHGGFFRPVFILSFYLDCAVWGVRPFGFHLTNLALHAANAFLVFLLTRALLRARRPEAAERRRPVRVAFVAGLIFLLHPSHTEAVTWVSGRVDLLAAFFFLISAVAYVSRAGRGKTGVSVFALATFALALLSKESAACLPLAVFVFAVYLGGGEGRAGRLKRGLKEAAPFFALLGVYVAARAVVLGELVGGYGAARHLDFTHSIVASQLLRFSLRAVLPSVVLRGFPFLESRALSPVLIALGALAVLAAAALLRRATTRAALSALARRHTFPWLMVLLFACSLPPVINLRINVFDTQGERFLYLPSAFYAPALAYLCAWAHGEGRRAALRAAALASLLVFYAASLWATNRNWGEAARLSKSIAGELAAHSTRDAVLLLNAPDNLRGAYVYRNGLGRALLSFQSAKPIGRAHVVAWSGLRTPLERFELSEEAGAYTLRPSGGATGFERAGETLDCAREVSISADVLRVRPGGCAEVFDVFYFSEGKIHRVAVSQRP